MLWEEMQKFSQRIQEPVARFCGAEGAVRAYSRSFFVNDERIFHIQEAFVFASAVSPLVIVTRRVRDLPQQLWPFWASPSRSWDLPWRMGLSPLMTVQRQRPAQL